jgi:limonene-1,2-epoxide hydrolase
MDPPNRGTEAIRAMIGGFLGMAQDVEFVVHQQAENPATGIVMNERTDRFKLANGRWAALRVMGVFELRNGKILAWRDYFDMAEAQRELGF